MTRASGNANKEDLERKDIHSGNFLCEMQAFTLLLGTIALMRAAGATINLLPLGDSITLGCGSVATAPSWYAFCTSECGGYRAPLYGNISAAGLDVSFVGSSSDGPSWVPPAQRHHEGHPGWRIDQISGIASKWLSYQPDVILIHLGTNDISQKSSLSGLVSHMEKLLSIIQQNSSSGLWQQPEDHDDQPVPN